MTYRWWFKIHTVTEISYNLQATRNVGVLLQLSAIIVMDAQLQ